MREYFSIIRQAYKGFSEGSYRDAAATMGLHLVMGMTALGIVLAWLAGVTDLQADPITGYIRELVGPNAASVFDSLLRHASTSWRAWVPVTAAALVLVWNVVSLMRHVQRTINTAVGVRFSADPRQYGAVMLKRIAGTAFVLVAALGLLASFSAKTALEVFDYLGVAPVADSPWAFRAAEVVLALILATVLFAGIFRLLPDAKLKFRLIWHGAFWAAKLYTAVQILSAFAIVYVGGMSYYGEAVVLLVLVAYLYFASVSFLWGAQVLRVDLQRHRAAPKPSKWAVRDPERGPLGEEDERADTRQDEPDDHGEVSPSEPQRSVG